MAPATDLTHLTIITGTLGGHLAQPHPKLTRIVKAHKMALPRSMKLTGPQRAEKKPFSLYTHTHTHTIKQN